MQNEMLPYFHENFPHFNTFYCSGTVATESSEIKKTFVWNILLTISVNFDFRIFRLLQVFRGNRRERHNKVTYSKIQEIKHEHYSTLNDEEKTFSYKYKQIYIHTCIHAHIKSFGLNSYSTTEYICKFEHARD